MSQPDLFEAMEAGRDKDWIEDGLEVLRLVALYKRELTADDLWDKLKDRPKEPRALGLLMRRAAREGFIRRTDMTVKCKRPERHGGDVRVWRSLIVREAA